MIKYYPSPSQSDFITFFLSISERLGILVVVAAPAAATFESNDGLGASPCLAVIALSALWSLLLLVAIGLLRVVL